MNSKEIVVIFTACLFGSVYMDTVQETFSASIDAIKPKANSITVLNGLALIFGSGPYRGIISSMNDIADTLDSNTGNPNVHGLSQPSKACELFNILSAKAYLLSVLPIVGTPVRNAVTKLAYAIQQNSYKELSDIGIDSNTPESQALKADLDTEEICSEAAEAAYQGIIDLNP